MASASGILVGAQHPFCKTLHARFQSVILEIFDDIAKVPRKLMRHRARERWIGVDQLLNDLERDQQKLTPLQGACGRGIKIVRYRREHERLDRANDGDRGPPIMMFAEQLNRASEQRV